VAEGTSWTAEIAVPWKTLGVTPAAGHQFGLTIVRNRVLDRRRGQRTHLPGGFGEPKDPKGYPVFALEK